MLPLLSTKNVNGIWTICHFVAVEEFHPPSSFTCSHVSLSAFIACFQSFELSSMETLRISKPLSLYFEYNLTIDLFAWRQGPHQDAQKSKTKTFPFNDDNCKLSPFCVGSLKSNLGSAMFTVFCANIEIAENRKGTKNIIFRGFIG